MSKRLLYPAAALLLLVAIARADGPASMTRPQNTAGRDWTVYGGTAEGTRYSSLRQITRANVSRLTQAWQFDPHEGAVGGRFQVNPIVVGGILFTTTPGGSLIALDGATGTLKWSWNSGTRGGGRGVTYWATAGTAACRVGRYVRDRRHHGPAGAAVRPRRPQSISADLGRDQRQSAPVDARRDRLGPHIVGGRTSGACRRRPATSAPDVRQCCGGRSTPSASGSLAPTPAGRRVDHIGSANNWAGMAVDVPPHHHATGSAASDFYGANWLGDNYLPTRPLRSTRQPASGSGISRACGTTSGTVIFPRRHAGHGDAVARRSTRWPDDKARRAVLFDRANGTPLFPDQDRAVPPSGVRAKSRWDAAVLAPSGARAPATGSADDAD